MVTTAIDRFGLRCFKIALSGAQRAAGSGVGQHGGPPSPLWRLRSGTLRARLAWLAVACVAPVWLVAGFLVFQSYHDKRALVEQHMLDTARALSLTVDQYLSNIQGMLRLLASSPYLATNDLAAFHRQARDVLIDYPEADIILADADGQQRINTYRTFGEPLPRRNVPDSVHRLFETGQPIITDLFQGAMTKRFMIGLDVPVMQDGRVIYDLSMTLPAAKLGDILLHERLPLAWLGVIVDRNGVVAARTLNPDRFVGQSVRPIFHQWLSLRNEGVFDMPSFEEIPGTWAFTRSSETGWTVALSVPTGLLLADAHRWLLWTVAGASLASVLGIGLALIIGRRIARSIQGLTGPATALGHGEPVTIGPLDLHETNEVGQALTQASRALQERSQERDIAERILAERTRKLERHYENLQSLNEIAALSWGTTQSLLSRALALGARHLGFETGVISRVEGTRAIIEYQAERANQKEASPSPSTLTFDLDGTYCALTLESDDVVLVPHRPQQPEAQRLHSPHPALGAVSAESYAGAPIRVCGQPYGTVHFASAIPSPHGFDEGDLEFMRLLGRWIGTALERDLSDREIHTARHDAETANQAKTEFLAMMSHEIRTPLTVILGFSEIIRDQAFGPINNSTYTEYANDINTSGHHLLDVVNDILDIAKIEAGKMEISPELIEPAALLTTAIRLVKERALRRDLVIDHAAPQTLPFLWADPRAAKQILFNLLSNAIKFTPRGGRITVTAAANGGSGGGDGGDLLVTVTDTGIGIPPDHLQRVLRPFERIDNRYTRKANGTGLGLPLVKALMELHNGSLTINSGPGIGTTVSLRFPPPPGKTPSSLDIAPSRLPLNTGHAHLRP